MRLVKKTGYIVLFLLAVDLIACIVFLHIINRNVGKLPSKITDAAIVLFSGFDGTASLNSETLRRTNYAIKLYEEKLFSNIICVGGARPGRDLYGAELMKNEFVSHGVSPNLIHFEKRSNDTKSNLFEAFNIVHKSGWKSATILTSPLHIYRVQWMISNFKKDVSVFFSAYSYSDSIPRIGWYNLWLQIHYEWVSYALVTILPARFYQDMINTLRS